MKRSTGVTLMAAALTVVSAATFVTVRATQPVNFSRVIIEASTVDGRIQVLQWLYYQANPMVTCANVAHNAAVSPEWIASWYATAKPHPTRTFRTKQEAVQFVSGHWCP